MHAMYFNSIYQGMLICRFFKRRHVSSSSSVLFISYSIYLTCLFINSVNVVDFNLTDISCTFLRDKEQKKFLACEIAKISKTIPI